MQDLAISRQAKLLCYPIILVAITRYFQYTYLNVAVSSNATVQLLLLYTVTNCAAATVIYSN